MTLVGNVKLRVKVAVAGLYNYPLYLCDIIEVELTVAARIKARIICFVE
jgi:hypothetical protein